MRRKLLASLDGRLEQERLQPKLGDKKENLQRRFQATWAQIKEDITAFTLTINGSVLQRKLAEEDGELPLLSAHYFRNAQAQSATTGTATINSRLETALIILTTDDKWSFRKKINTTIQQLLPENKLIKTSLTPGIVIALATAADHLDEKHTALILDLMCQNKVKLTDIALNKDGDNLLHLAAMGHFSHLISLLYNNNLITVSELDIKNIHGETPRSIAQHLGDEATVDFIDTCHASVKASVANRYRLTAGDSNISQLLLDNNDSLTL